MKKLVEKLKIGKKGMTLVELVVAMGVFGIFMLTLSIFLSSNLRLFTGGNIKIQTKEAADNIAEAVYKEVRSSREFVLRNDLGSSYVLKDGETGAVNEATYDDAVNDHSELSNNAYIYSANGKIWYTTKAGGQKPVYDHDVYKDFDISDLRFRMSGENRNLLTIRFVIKRGKDARTTITKSYDMKNLTDAQAGENPDYKKLYFTYAGVGYCQKSGSSGSWCKNEHNCSYTTIKRSGIDVDAGYFDKRTGLIHEWCTHYPEQDIAYFYEPDSEFAVLGYKRPEKN